MLRRWVLMQPETEIYDRDKIDLVHVFDVVLGILGNMHNPFALLMTTKLESMLRNYAGMRAHRRRVRQTMVDPGTPVTGVHWTLEIGLATCSNLS